MCCGGGQRAVEKFVSGFASGEKKSKENHQKKTAKKLHISIDLG